MGWYANAKAVYAHPVEHDGVTVIPVAKLKWGFGGGSGRKQGKRGKGGGGGLQNAPLGYIEIKDGQAEFKPIRDPMTFVPLAAAVQSPVLDSPAFSPKTHPWRISRLTLA